MLERERVQRKLDGVGINEPGMGFFKTRCLSMVE
jgi:hypothetical protein